MIIHILAQAEPTPNSFLQISSKHKVFYLDVENFNFDKNTENLIDKTLNIETIPYITYYNNGKLTKSINDSSATIEDVLALSLEK